MSASGETVIVEIVGGPSQTVPWSTDMTAQNALESARNLSPAGSFNFALEYFGSSLGYMVIMLNGTFESLMSPAAPDFYWDFLIDGTPSPVGIDSAKLKPGSKISFRFDIYQAQKHAGTTLAAKYKARGGKA